MTSLYGHPSNISSPSFSVGRTFRPLPPRPSPPPLDVTFISPIEDLVPTERLPSRPKRATYILQWATGVQPGSPTVRSPDSARLAASPLLSASTEDLALKLMQFAGLPAGQPSIRPDHIDTSLSSALPSSGILSKKPSPLDSASPSIVSPRSALRSIPVSAGRRTRMPPSNRRSSVYRRASRRATLRSVNRNVRGSRALGAVAESNPDDAQLRRVAGRLSRQMSAAAARQSGALAPADATNREVFLDDEEWEFAPLVVADDDVANDDGEWVDFECCPKTASTPESASAYSHPSDLNSAYIMPNPHDLRSPAQATPPDSGSALPSGGSGGSKTSGSCVLAIPARSQRKAAHLRKPSYVTDLEPFVLPKSPLSPAAGVPRPWTPAPKGAARRRPSPLDIPPPPSATRFSGVSPLDAQMMRMAFVAQSFAPRALAADVGAVPFRPPTPEEDADVRGRRGVRGARGLGSGVKTVLSAVSSSIRTGNSSRSVSGRREN